ncbi:alpha/beta fold hydrolase [Alkalimonas mucilaginosa]|uniref:Alpha/beta hydrolase n=1 Tax=Alkalimonas mucilaginosa TaxID=3057676 RepID=A0ABU7JKK0_9GAMM|nr:alpha/beta hydrolase [Alkalimonas sp. MEB004]MEE2025493.1 alpha/beta hydrolase [Alkalimonas sp. MEB004]
MKKTTQQPGFWTYLVIALSIVIGVLSANLKAEPTHFQVQVVGQGQPVLMIPGLMSDSRTWQPLQAELAASYQLHLITLAGFAGNAPVNGPLLPKVREQLQAYILSENLQQPAIIGHSLGAFVAFDLASHQPQLIGPVIAIDGLPYLAPVFTRSNQTQVRDMQAQASAIRSQYQQMSAQQLAAMAQHGLGIQASSQPHQQLVLEMAATSDPASVGQALYELLTTDLRQQISAIQSPVLLLGASGAITGDKERQQIEQLYRQQLAELPQARLAFHPQSRHFMTLDQPEWVAHHILTALKEASQ